MHVKSVSYTTNNRKGRSDKNTKRFPVVFYLDSNLMFHSKRIKWYQVPYYKAKIKKQVRIFCTECQKKFDVLVKKNEVALCPQCLS